jgi:hypothetical protein
MSVGGPSASSSPEQLEETAAVSPGDAAIPTTAPDFGPENAVERVMAAGVAALFENEPPLADPCIDDFRSPEAAAAALAKPLATPAGSQPLGPAAVFRPGLGNTHASPAFLFRMAQYTGKLLIAYPNAAPGADLAPKPATEIDGVPVPPELRGKIFVSGDPANRMIPWDAASDLFERQLEAASGSDFLGGKPVDAAKLTVVAHSQGGLDAASARRDLAQRGRPNEIGRLVTLNSPFGGSPLAEAQGGGLLAKALGATVGGAAPEAIEHLDPKYMATSFGPQDRRLVDVAVTSTVDGEDTGNVRAVMKGLAVANRYNPLSQVRGPGDGFVSEASMSFGKALLPLPRAYDHAGIAEDPAVIDDVARALAKTRP